MSERLPYEDSLRDGLNDLPLPSEEQSWQQMKKLLEEDDDRVPPPVFLRGCIGWGFLLLVALGGLWLIIRPDKWWNGKTSSAAQHSTPAKSNGLQTPDSTHLPIDNGSITTRIYTGDSLSIRSSTTQGGARSAPFGAGDAASAATPALRKRSSSQGAIGDAGKGQTASRSSHHGNAPGMDRPTVTSTRKRASAKNKGAGISSAQPVVPPSATAPHQDTVITTQKPMPARPGDTLRKVVRKPAGADTAAKKEKQKEKEKEKAKYYVSTGIGVQQQIPIAGQKSTPYNYYGRKGSLADYIPSVYVRLHREERWFIQGEFRYGAPQAVRQLVYNQQSVLDSAQQTRTTSRLRLQKTFYHQLPLSFNYYVLPHLSVGAGVMYSRFHGAVSAEEVTGTNPFTQGDSLLSRKIVKVPSNTDSFFTRSQLHLLFQTEYTWRRLSLSLRYTRGVQPFIRYTDPSGAIKEEMNQSFQALLRFRVWRSKKK